MYIDLFNDTGVNNLATNVHFFVVANKRSYERTANDKCFWRTLPPLVVTDSVYHPQRLHYAPSAPKISRNNCTVLFHFRDDLLAKEFVSNKATTANSRPYENIKIFTSKTPLQRNKLQLQKSARLRLPQALLF